MEKENILLGLVGSGCNLWKSGHRFSGWEGHVLEVEAKTSYGTCGEASKPGTPGHNLS